MRKCTAITNAGRTCKCFAIPGTNPPRCLFHCSELPEGCQHRYQTKPLEEKEQIAILEREVRRLSRIKDKSLDCTRTLLATITLLREVKGTGNDQKKDDPEWMKKFRRS